MGHIHRYRTHSLRLADASEMAPPKRPPDSPCGCPILKGRLDLAHVNLQEERAAFDKFHAQRKSHNGELPPRWQRSFIGGAVLTHEQYHPENPFWVVSVDPRIIDGHNDFYSPALMHFLRQLYDDALREPVAREQRRLGSREDITTK